MNDRINSIDLLVDRAKQNLTVQPKKEQTGQIIQTVAEEKEVIDPRKKTDN